MEQRESDVLEAVAKVRSRAATRRALLALVLILGAGLATVSAVAVHYKREADRRPNAPRSTTSPAPRPVQPSITRSTSRLLRGTVTVQLTSVVMPNAETGKLIIMGHVAGGVPHHRYVLGGSACPDGRGHVWASGVTDSTGQAQLTGPVWTLSAARSYYLSIDPQPLVSGPRAPATGIGFFLVGAYATPILGQQAPCL